MVLHKLSLDKPSPSPCENGTDYLIGVENAPKTGKRAPTQSKYLLQSLGKIFSSLAPAQAGNSFVGWRPEKEGPLNHDLSALSRCRNYASELVPAAIQNSAANANFEPQPPRFHPQLPVCESSDFRPYFTCGIPSEWPIG